LLFGYHWNLSSDWSFAISILPMLLKGMVVTCEATVLGFLVALVLGLLLALLRMSPLRLAAWPAAFVIEFLRDTPLLVQLYFLYFVLPLYGLSLPAFLTGTLALGLQYSAYTSEVYRAGIKAVPKGQWEAAIALDLSLLRTYRDVIVPQAIPRILPALGNYLVSIIKDTPILSAVTVLEMLDVAKMVGDRTFRYMVPLSMVGALFLLLTLLTATALRCLERRLPKQGIPLR
jgi:polar amino acid transport system permease protein